MRYNQQCTTATCRFTVEELDYWKAGDVVVPENAPLTINNLNFKTVPPHGMSSCVGSSCSWWLSTGGLDCSGEGGCELPASLQKAGHHEPHPRGPTGRQIAARSREPLKSLKTDEQHINKTIIFSFVLLSISRIFF